MKKDVSHTIVVWFAGLVIVIGAAASLLTRCDDLALYWKEWYSFQRHLTVGKTGVCGLKDPILSPSVARLDPEAAAITERIFDRFRRNRHNTIKNELESFAELSLKYPDNPYFLYDLACRVADRREADPQLVDALADRLLQMNPSNGRYYFLKAWAAFYDWGENRLERTLDYLEKCFSCSENNDPYDLYRPRVNTLIERERITSVIANAGTEWRTFGDTLLLHDMTRNLLLHTQDLIVNGQVEQAMRLHDRLQKIAERSIPRPMQKISEYFWIYFTPSSYSIHSGLPQTPQMVELQYLDLDPRRAAQHRRQMLAWKTVKNDISNQWEAQKKTADRQLVEFEIRDSNVPIAAHTFQVSLTALAVVLLFGGLGIVRGLEKNSLSKTALIALGLLCGVWFAACRLGDYQTMNNELCNHYSFDCVPFSIFTMGVLASFRSVALWLLMGSGLLFALLTAVYVVRNPKRRRLWKMFIKISAAAVLISLWLTFSSLRAATVLADLVVLLLIILLCGLRFSEIKQNTCAGLLGSGWQARQYRSRCLTMACCVFVLHFAVFAGTASNLLNYAKLIRRAECSVSHPIQPAPFAANEHTYAAILSRFQTDDPLNIELNEWLPLINPADIPGTLETLRRRRLDDDRPGASIPSDGSVMMMPFSDMYSKSEGNLFPELPGLLQVCGRDAVPHIIPFLKDPNSTTMLIIRGRAGDLSARSQLVDLWKKNRDAGFPQKDWPFDTPDSVPAPIPLDALVRICPFEEFRGYLAEFYQTVMGYKDYVGLTNDMMPYWTREQKGQIIEEVLGMPKTAQTSSDTIREWLFVNANLSSDARSRIWKRLIEEADREKYGFDPPVYRRKPYDYRMSDDLLEECMTSGSEKLRALGQHIYRTMKKPLDEPVVRRWATDDNILIRANAVLLVPTLEVAADPSPLVRLVKTLPRKGSLTAPYSGS
jgi:hypothetical protein